MTAPFTNADGLQVKYPGYFIDPYNKAVQVRAVSTLGNYKEAVLDFDLTQIPTGTVSYTSDLNNDGTLDGFNDGDFRLPANASVISARVVMKTAATGGTSITIGTFRETGAAISANSIMTATEGVIANMNAIGLRTQGAGALVSTSAGTAGVGANDAYIGITTSGTYTAGTGRLYLTYADPLADAEANV